MLRRAVELGVNFIDTADSYGPFVQRAAHPGGPAPVRRRRVIATKGGFTRQGPGLWTAVGRPEYLQQQAELSLRHLGVERIDLYQLHRIDPEVPLADQLGALRQLPRRGQDPAHRLVRGDRVRDQGGARITDIVSVQNRYSLTSRDAEELLDYSEREGIAFIPWYPIAVGELARPGGPLDKAAAAHEASPGQLALAWLLHRSPVMLPIPGTSSVAHLEENMASAAVKLTDAEFTALGDAAAAA